MANGEEKLKGTSFVNFQEVDATIEMFKLCTQWSTECAEIHKEIPEIPDQRFTKRSIYVITPYNAQKNAIADKLVTMEM